MGPPWRWLSPRTWTTPTLCVPCVMPASNHRSIFFSPLRLILQMQVIYIAQMEVDKQCHVTMVCTFVSLHAVFVYGWSYVIGIGANGILTGFASVVCSTLVRQGVFCERLAYVAGRMTRTRMADTLSNMTFAPTHSLLSCCVQSWYVAECSLSVVK